MRSIIRCDICEKENPQCLGLSIQIGIEPDPTGEPGPVMKDVDICPDCVQKSVQSCVNEKITYKAGLKQNSFWFPCT